MTDSKIITRTLLVCDNRDSLNWGCRATSIALGQIIYQYSFVDSIFRRSASRPHPIGPFSPFFDTQGGLLTRVWRGCTKTKGLRTAYNIIGGQSDFVSSSATASLRNFLKHKKRDKKLGELFDLFAQADQVIINGEGSLIFRDPPRRDLDFQLFCIELAHHLGKPVHFVNAMASDCPKSGTNQEVVDAVLATLGKADSVLLRDPVSATRLRELGIPDVTWVPDALFSWANRYRDVLANGLVTPTELIDCWPESDHFFDGWQKMPSEYIAVSGASRPPGQNPASWAPFFEGLIRSIKSELRLPVVIVDPFGDDFLQPVSKKTNSIFIRSGTNILAGASVLANASTYISGRYHPSILASTGGTPCVMLPSNSHKTHSLQEVLGYDEPRTFCFDATQKNYNSILEQTHFLLKKGDTLRNEIASTSRGHGQAAESAFGAIVQD